jgi:hypothetical protein
MFNQIIISNKFDLNLSTTLSSYLAYFFAEVSDKEKKFYNIVTSGHVLKHLTAVSYAFS